MKTRALAAAFALAVCLLSSGCWDRSEIDELGIIGSMGLDKGENDKVVVSLEIINPGALTSGTSSPPTASTVAGHVMRDEASTISSAIANAQRRTPRSLSTGQINTIIFGQALARGGIGQYIDFLIRDAGVRRSVLLATCDTGSGLLQRPMMESIPSRTLSGLAKAAEHSGKTIAITLNEFMVRLTEPGIEPVMMHTVGRRTKDVVVKAEGEEIKQKDPAHPLEQPVDVDVEMESELPDDSPILDPYKEAGTGQFVPGITIDIGIAAYRDDKLVGLIDGVGARGFLWVTGQLEHGVVEVPAPGRPDKKVGLDVIRASSSIKPVTDGKLAMEVELHVDLEGSQIPMGVDLRNPETITQVEALVKDLIIKESEDTLRRVQELKTDIYGFGHRIYRDDPRLWAQLEAKWNDEIFPALEVNLDVKTRVRAPGAAFSLGTKP